ncbi:MAG: hypothetical protein K8S98_11130 [Planctomycetes bacterium]|nr:hypothetical protein [Planctomycetota bacterium]
MQRSIRNALICAAFVLASGGPATATQRVELARALGDAGDEHGVGLAPLDAGCVVSGWVALDAHVEAGLLERLDLRGDVVWRRTFPGGDDAALWSVAELPSGGFVAAGWSKSARGDLDAFCVRTSATGDLLWTRSYEAPGDERLWSLDVTSDGFVAAGETAASGRSCAFVLRLGLDGIERERRTHGEAEVERVFAVRAQNDGGYVLAGLAGSGPPEGPGFDARIAAYDAGGRRTWKRDFGGAGFDVAHDVERAADGTLRVVGYTDVGGEHGIDAFLLTLAKDGSVVSTHTYGGPRDDRVVHCALLADGRAALIGYTRSADDWDIVVRLVDSTGASTWEQRFGGDEPELGRSIAAAPDGKVWVVGHSRSYGPRERLLLLRFAVD